MKYINMQKVIREIEEEKYPESSKNNIQPVMNNLINSELEIVIQIIKDNIEKDDRESYEQLDHYCQQWQERYNNLLDKYLKLSDKYFDLYDKPRKNKNK